MELLRGRQPGVDSKLTAQECHHVDTFGHDKTVSEQRWGANVLPQNAA